MERLLVLAGFALLAAAGFAAWSARSTGFMTAIVRNSRYDLRLETPPTIATGSPATLVIRTFRNGGATDVTRERHSLHAVLLSADDEDMVHTVNFRFREDGSAELDRVFTRPGTYRLWIEVDDDTLENPHGANAALVAWQDIAVTGAPLPPETPPTEGVTASASGFTLTMSHGPLVAGKPAELRFAVTGADGKTVVLPMHDPVLFGLTSETRDYFLHGHMFTDPGWRAASYGLTFPHPGRYDLFTQAFWLEGLDFRLMEAHFILIVSSGK